MNFADTLRSARLRSGRSQTEVAELSGVARPNVAAYEKGRREPRVSTAERLLGAVDTELVSTPRITWRWTQTPRPYAIPSRLWHLDADLAFGVFVPSPHLWWSGRPPTLELADRRQRARAYELLLREGQPQDIECIVDGNLLIDLFDDLVLPKAAYAGWIETIKREIRSESRPNLA